MMREYETVLCVEGKEAETKVFGSALFSTYSFYCAGDGNKGLFYDLLNYHVCGNTGMP